jgi:hypothetical protein
MITVNPVFLHEVLAPLIGGADDNETVEKYGHFKTDVESEVKILAREVLQPEFHAQNPVLQQVAKHTLAYYLEHSNKVDFESIFNSLLLPLETPKNVRLFFRWIWDIFFPGQSTDYIKNELVVEDFDVNAAYYLLTGTDNYNSPLN